MKIKDLNGSRFYRLVALAPVHKRDSKGRAAIHWRCQCDCGEEAVVAGGALRAGLTRSCGCLMVESRKAANIKHGGAGTRLYNIWSNMRARCGDKNHPAYSNYGGRGISVCERWQNSFENFRSDVGEPPSLTHSLDRHPNNDGDYELSNVRWATPTQQARNKRGTLIIEIKSIRYGLADAADEFGVDYDTLHRRIESGWTPEQAVNLVERPSPSGWKVSNRRRFNGSIVEASRER